MFNTPCTVCSFFRVERYTTELKFDSIYENDITFCTVTSHTKLYPFDRIMIRITRYGYHYY